MTALEVRDGRMEVVVGTGVLAEVARGFGFTEGVVWNPVDHYLVFSDIPGSCMYRVVGDEVSVYRRPTDMSNGNAYDPQGRLVTCQHATSRVVREEADGTLTVLADEYDGLELNSPNDVIVARDGTVLFTDPTYGRNGMFGVARPVPQPVRGVYALGPAGVLRRLADDFEQPNGLCLTQDERFLFVNDTGRSHVRRFDYRADGTLGGGDVWAEVTGTGNGAPDGMKIDGARNLWCTGPGGVHVFAPDATCLGVLRTPQQVANFTWGDDDLRTLYLCGATALYRTRVLVPGR